MDPARQNNPGELCLVCAHCQTLVALEHEIITGSHPTNPSFVYEYQLDVLHTECACYSATNPSDHRFDVVRLSIPSPERASVYGTASAEQSWFPPFSWRMACCPGCSAHLGWRFDLVEGNARECSTEREVVGEQDAGNNDPQPPQAQPAGQGGGANADPFLGLIITKLRQSTLADARAPHDAQHDAQRALQSRLLRYFAQLSREGEAAEEEAAEEEDAEGEDAEEESDGDGDGGDGDGGDGDDGEPR